MSRDRVYRVAAVVSKLDPQDLVPSDFISLQSSEQLCALPREHRPAYELDVSSEFSVWVVDMLWHIAEDSLLFVGSALHLLKFEGNIKYYNDDLISRQRESSLSYS